MYRALWAHIRTYVPDPLSHGEHVSVWELQYMYIAQMMRILEKFFSNFESEGLRCTEKEDMVAGYVRMFRWSPVSPLVCQHSSPLTLRDARKPVKPIVSPPLMKWFVKSYAQQLTGSYRNSPLGDLLAYALLPTTTARFQCTY